MTLNDPDLADLGIGVSGPFTSYYLTLPKQIPLPTFQPASERLWQKGTSLAEAVDQKLTSLSNEFERLRVLTKDIEWCQKAWWNESTGRLTLQDWLLADAIYRSRGLDLPTRSGESMVPVLDMANHSGSDRYNARFEIDVDGRVLLVVRDGMTIEAGDEITINYGAGGASEMLFSYGFLEENLVSAREMYLSLDGPDDDPLWMAKMHVVEEAPGVRIFKNSRGSVIWDSGFIWWMCVNEEDGLDFNVLQHTDGKRELKASWNGVALNPANLRDTLMRDERRDIFRLRAAVMIQNRVEEQGELLSASQADFEDHLAHATPESGTTLERIRVLRDLELKLLTEAYDALEEDVSFILPCRVHSAQADFQNLLTIAQKQDLLQSRSVTEYLSKGRTVHEVENGHEEEDFS